MLEVILFCGRTGRGTGAELLMDSMFLRSDGYNGLSDDNASTGNVLVLLDNGELEFALLTGCTLLPPALCFLNYVTCNTL